MRFKISVHFMGYGSVAGGVGGAGKKWKGNFGFCFRRFIPPKRTRICILAWWQYSVRPFLRHSRRAKRFLSAFCGNFIVRSHFATTSHWPLALAGTRLVLSAARYRSSISDDILV